MDDRPLLVTLDTNQLDQWRITSLAEASTIPVSFATITVNVRERGSGYEVRVGQIKEGAVWGESLWGQAVWSDGGVIPETFVIGESRIGEGVIASSAGASLFEQALRIISSGSFPPRGQRDDLTPARQRQLRDAMTFEAHVRAQRHVLVTLDRDMSGEPRRTRLQQLGRTWVLHPDEFVAMRGLSGGHAQLLVPPP